MVTSINKDIVAHTATVHMKERITITPPYGAGNIFIVALFREARNVGLCRASDIQAG